MEYKEGNELIEYYVGSKTKVWLVKRPDFSLIKSKRYEFHEFHTSYLILPTSYFLLRKPITSNASYIRSVLLTLLQRIITRRYPKLFMKVPGEIALRTKASEGGDLIHFIITGGQQFCRFL
jgi:hypothetical protein